MCPVLRPSAPGTWPRIGLRLAWVMSWFEPSVFPPVEAGMGFGFLVELGGWCWIVAPGERRKVTRGDVSNAVIGPPIRGPEMAVGHAELLRQRIHLVGEGLLGPGNAFREHHRRIVPGQSDDALEQILDADLLVRGTGTWSSRPAGHAISARSRVGPCTFCLSGSWPQVDQLERDLGRSSSSPARPAACACPSSSHTEIAPEDSRRPGDAVFAGVSNCGAAAGGSAGEENRGGGGKEKGARHGAGLKSPIEVVGRRPVYRRAIASTRTPTDIA